MEGILGTLLSPLSRLTPLAVVDIALTAFLIYQFLLMIRGRRAAHVLLGLSFVVALYLAALLADLELLRMLLEKAAPYTAFALIVMFQSEIRRVLARIGGKGTIGFGGRLKRKEFVDEILLALEHLSKTKTGAIIVIERDIGLRTFVESGVWLDAVVSRDLLLSIFHPKGALHDGAVIIQNERIAAAACFLPTTTNPVVVGEHGTRHRAGVGVTEESDCLSLLVSEETGMISAASFGDLYRDLTIERVDDIMTAHLRGRTKEEPLTADEIQPKADRDGTEEPGLNPANRP